MLLICKVYCNYLNTLYPKVFFKLRPYSISKLFFKETLLEKIPIPTWLYVFQASISKLSSVETALKKIPFKNDWIFLKPMAYSKTKLPFIETALEVLFQ